MQEPLAHRHDSPGTQGERYTAAEIALFDQLAHRRVTKAELLDLFPQRTAAAVKKQIVEARHRLGLIEKSATESHARQPTMLHADDEGFEDGWERRHRCDMTRGNTQFLAALLAA